MRASLTGCALALLAACGGGGSSDDGPTVNQAPVPVIATPAEGTTFQAGDTLSFSGSASDAEDGVEPASRLAWWVDLHHDTHTHPFVPETSGGSGTVTLPTRTETSDNIWYRFHLRATDSAGLTTEVTRDVLPRKAQFTLATVPAGLALTLDGQPVTAPVTVTGVIGTERDLAATDQQANGRRYRFDGWSDGGAASHTISTPATATTYTANFTDLGPIANQAPVPVIASPPAGTMFQGGDTVAFSGSASDLEDGAEPATRLTWWVDLHHDTHTHPFVPETTGATGLVTIPTRTETSDNIWFRFHLRATDSAGLSSETTRDILPRKVQFTLATVPAGLALTLDGQPVTGPTIVTGVVGIERDLGAADQQANGRRYRFASWSDGQPASHTISTPTTATTYTATFTDIGPVNNQAPSVTLSAAATGTVGTAMGLTAAATDSDGTVTQVEFFDGATSLNVDTAAPFAFSWTPATSGTHALTAVATDDQGATTRSAAVSVNVAPGSGADTQPPSIAMTAPADLTQNINGTVTLTATASDNVGVVGVEFQVDGQIVGSEVTSPPYSVAVDTLPYAHGQHIFRARARDAAGNVSAWSRITVTFGGASRLPAGFSRNDTWITGMGSPTTFAQAPDGRIFVAEKAGSLRVIKNGVLLTTPFHQFTVDQNGERGLIGVTFHPDFANNGFVYVHYTATTPAAHNRISRLVANGDVSSGAETILVDLPNLSSSFIHNGGALHFGVDGKLYVSVGENGTAANAQDLTKPLGKILRFNEDGTIPTDNPFYNQQTGLARAIWAYGLRNPFTFAIQPGTGRMHINDVGQSTWEEINLGAAGANYGWPGSEGPDNLTPSITAPIFTYNHNPSVPAGSGPGGFIVGSAVVGGAFYPANGSFPAAYRNSYFFADYPAKWVRRMDTVNQGDVYGFANNFNGYPVDLMVGLDGALYVLNLNGTITRIGFP